MIHFIVVMSVSLALLLGFEVCAAEKNDDRDIINHLEKVGYDYNSLQRESDVKKAHAPLLGDLDLYRGYAADKGGYIDQIDSKGHVTRRITQEGIYSSDQPLVLEGHIKINGPIVIENDLILNGITVTGQGALFSARNIHVFGDIVADSRPYYDKNILEKTGDNEYVPHLYDDILDDGSMTGGVVGQCKENNRKGAIVLAAKGNIMIGDIRELERSHSDSFKTEPYEVHGSDSSIGYTTGYFDNEWTGSYDDEDGGIRPGVAVLGEGDRLEKKNPKTISIKKIPGAKDPFGWSSYVEQGSYIAIYDAADPGLARDSDGAVIITPNMIYEVDHISGKSNNLKIKGNLDAIPDSGRIRVVVTDPSKAVKRKFFEPTLSDIDIAAYSKGILETTDDDNKVQDTGKMSRIDATLYTNHLLAGRFYHIDFFGSMISRNRRIHAAHITAVYDFRAKSSPITRYLPIGIRAPKRLYRREN